MENYSYFVKLRQFQQKCGQKPCIMMYLSNIHFMCMVPVIFGQFFLKSFKNGPFLTKLKMFRGGCHHVPQLASRYPSGFKQQNTIGKKSSLTSNRQRPAQVYILHFLSKECIFRAENDIFWGKSFYTKLISDQKYIKYNF